MGCSMKKIVLDNNNNNIALRVFVRDGYGNGVGGTENS